MSAVEAFEWQWLVYPENGNTWRCPLPALGHWTARGWEPCDAPAEVDPTKDPGVEAPVADVAAPDAPEDADAAPAGKKTSKPTVAGGTEGTD